MKKTTLLVTAVAVIVLSAVAADAQTLVDLGVDSIVSDMSDDGQVVVGTLGLGGGAFRWTPGGGIEILANGGDPYISGDGTVIGGTTDVGGLKVAARWSFGGGWQPLGDIPGAAPCGDSSSSVWAVDGDGSHIVGLAWLGCTAAHAFSWDAINGMVDLGSLDGGSSRANGVSANGRVVVGWDEAPSGYWRGTRWVDGVESLFDTTDSPGDAWAVNSDGSVIAGAYFGPAGEEAYRWTDSSGVQSIGGISGSNFSCQGSALSEDGNLIVGICGFGFAREGFAWTPQGGIVNINTFMADLGVTDLTGWFLDTPMSVSPDKRFVAGWGVGPGGLQGWLIDLNDTLPFFNDGFEAGDADSWSSTTP